MIPRATMRLQLHKGFTFADAARVAPYMARLGISHLYASPILAARPGSMHGYDVIDPTRINPELGGEAGFRDLVAALRAERLGIVVDIVPNHMAADSRNPWWCAMLRDGPESRYGRFFDIDWHPENPLLDGKVLLPVLGRPYGEALEAGEIGLERDAAGLWATYFDHRFPIRREDDPQPGIAGVALHELLERQHYRLAFWRTAPDEINWRRFFDINDLAALRAEDDEVFEASHALIFRLYAEGLIDGVRVDHIDGLSDPRAYCRRLRARLSALAPQSAPAWIVVEKILGDGEHLPDDWQVDGTTGYDFMDQVSAVQHAAESADALGELWASVSGRPADFAPEEEAARREILSRSFTAQLESVVGALHCVALQDPATRDLSRPAIRRAAVALLANFPVYRAYATGAVPGPGDAAAFARALAGAEANPRGARTDVLRRIVGWLAAPHDPRARIAATRFQQLSAPVAAKAAEDTAFYRYGRLISRNDVGFAAARLGIGVAEFHAANTRRAAQFPAAMLATATHDHKRGEDARARLAVLSEIPEEWNRMLRGWMERNARFRMLVRGVPAPSPGDEGILYQTLLGAWPLDGDLRGFAGRIAAWQQKALHEAKLFTSWVQPDPQYEDAASRFLGALLGDAGFVAEMSAFAWRIGPAGAVNGLVQAALKLTVPGVPDFYQGTEFWDLSLVDPDNRRPVDFAARTATFDADAPLPALVASWQDGRVKQAVIRRLLALRQAMPAPFAHGSYEPLDVAGPLADHLIAFARRHREARLVVLAPRCVMGLLAQDGGIRFTPEVWVDTTAMLPAGIAHPVRNVLTGAQMGPARTLAAADALKLFPLAVMAG